MQSTAKSLPEQRTDPKGELLHPIDKVIDPVCAMSVDSLQAAGSVVHNGSTYYFCSKSCQQKFRADPKRYLTQSMDQGVALPMAQDATGRGMALERFLADGA